MKYFVLLLLVATAYSDDDYVPKTREEIASTFRVCLQKFNVTRETFYETRWDMDSDNVLNRQVIRCMAEEFGFFNINDGFHRERMVKEFGGEPVRDRILKCIDDNPVDSTAVEKSVQSVLFCLENDNLTFYAKTASKEGSKNSSE